MKLKTAIFCLAMVSASGAIADVPVTPELQEDLATFDMTSSTLAKWMQDVLEMQGYACSEVLTMGGKVPRTNPETRRNVAISVTCEENSYFITVGIKTGWKINN